MTQVAAGLDSKLEWPGPSADSASGGDAQSRCLFFYLTLSWGINDSRSFLIQLYADLWPENQSRKDKLMCTPCLRGQTKQVTVNKLTNKALDKIPEKSPVCDRDRGSAPCPSPSAARRLGWGGSVYIRLELKTSILGVYKREFQDKPAWCRPRELLMTRLYRSSTQGLWKAGAQCSGKTRQTQPRRSEDNFYEA